MTYYRCTDWFSMTNMKICLPIGSDDTLLPPDLSSSWSTILDDEDGKQTKGKTTTSSPMTNVSKQYSVGNSKLG